jgi:hypothetical protein
MKAPCIHISVCYFAVTGAYSDTKCGCEAFCGRYQPMLQGKGVLLGRIVMELSQNAIGDIISVKNAERIVQKHIGADE